MNHAAPSFVCFAPSPSAHLIGNEHAVFEVLRAARGIFRSGLSDREIRSRIGRGAPSLQVIRAIVGRLVVKGAARPGKSSNSWRVK